MNDHDLFERRADDVAWIAAHGSQVLQTLSAQGHDISVMYVTERAAREHPGYTADLDHETDWAEPGWDDDVSDQAAGQAEAVNGKIVMLQVPLEGVGHWDGSVSGEYAAPALAIVIEDYLGVCPLFRLL